MPATLILSHLDIRTVIQLRVRFHSFQTLHKEKRPVYLEQPEVCPPVGELLVASSTAGAYRANKVETNNQPLRNIYIYISKLLLY